MSACACSSNQRVCNDSIAYDQLLVCPCLKSAEVRATLIVTPLMFIALNIMVHHIAGMLVLRGTHACNKIPRNMYFCTLCSSNTTDQKSHEVLVLFVRVALQRRLHLVDRSSTRGHFSSGDLYGAVSRLELMLALGNSRHSNARAAAHFQLAILSDCNTAWSVTWHFRSDFVR